jgi:hypothetical protein
MSRQQWVLIFLLMMLTLGCQDSHQKEADMQGSKYSIEQIRTRNEKDILAIPGVVGMGVGICKTGNECLKIYTSVPIDQVQNKLPEEMANIEFELEFVGEIKAE